MKIRRPKLWLALAVIAALLGTGISWLLATRSPAIIVTMPDGSQYQYAGANWGYVHSQPRLIAKLIDHLPASAAGFFRRNLSSSLGDLGPVGTGEQGWGFWFRQAGPVASAPIGARANARIQLADENGVVAGQPSYLITYGSVSKYALVLAGAVPGRSRFIEIQFISPATPQTPAAKFATIRIPNPAFGKYPQWQPEPFPATRQIGNSTISITRLAVGTDLGGRGRRGGRGGGSPGALIRPTTEFTLESKPPQDSTESWVAQNIELDDATSNRLGSTPSVAMGGPTYTLGGTLWPGEDAWRLKLQLKRAGGYPASDLITFTNVPLPAPGATNGATLSSQIHGVTIILRNYRGNTAISSGPFAVPYYLELQWPSPNSKSTVDYVQTFTDSGDQLQPGITLGDPYDRLIIFESLPRNTRYLTVTVAVQKLVPTEFLLKPPAATNWPK